MGLSSHQMNVKTILLNRLIEEEAYAEKPQGLRYTIKRPLYAYGRTPWRDSSKLSAELLMYRRSVVKISHDIGSILKWFFIIPG
jgi:hypothetical protein